MEKKQNLRGIKTEGANQKAFKEMILKMYYEEMSVKELFVRLKAYCKKFYAYYLNLDYLLEIFHYQVFDEFRKSGTFTVFCG